MFGSIGGFELLVLAAIGLLAFGPRKLPELGRSLARGLHELRKAAGEMRVAIEQEADLGEVRKVTGDLTQTLRQKASKAFLELEEEVKTTGEGARPAEERKGEPGGPPAP